VEPAELLEITVDREVFRVLLGVLLLRPFQKKANVKISEYKVVKMTHWDQRQIFLLNKICLQSKQKFTENVSIFIPVFLCRTLHPLHGSMLCKLHSFMEFCD